MQLLKYITVIKLLLTSILCESYKNNETIKAFQRRSIIAKFDCPVSKEVALDTLGQLTTLGDPDIFLSGDHCNTDNLCGDAVEKANKVAHHLHCLGFGSTNLVFGALVKAILKDNAKMCAYKKYLCFSNCLRKTSATADINQCGYKLHDALQYALDNFDVNHQLPFSCCAMKKMAVCTQEKLTKNCGKHVSNYAAQYFWEPVRSAFKVSCPGFASLLQCNKAYPKEMKNLEKLDSSSAKKTVRNFLEPLYKLLQNRGQRLPDLFPIFTSLSVHFISTVY